MTGYGFTCGYCKAEFDTPTGTGCDEAERQAQAAGWRLTLDQDSADYYVTCPDCVEGAMDVVPLHIPNGKDETHDDTLQ